MATVVRKRRRPPDAAQSNSNGNNTGNISGKKKTLQQPGLPRHKNSNTEKRKATSTFASTSGSCVRVSERYDKVGRLGEGTYGIVYKALDKQTGRHFALKRCIPHHEQSDGFPVTTMREIKALRIANGQTHIVQLECVAVSRSGTFLVLEYCEHDLAKLTDQTYQQRKRSPFNASECKSLAQQLLLGLSFMHSRHWLHRDLKMSNLLYHRGCLKIADFGLARPHCSRSNQMTPQVASLWYRAPEILFSSGNRSIYSYPMDIWSAGCIVAELSLGTPLLQGTSEVEQIKRMVTTLGRPSESDWQTLVGGYGSRTVLGFERPAAAIRDGRLLDRLNSTILDLLFDMLKYDPSKRVTATEALGASYFTNTPLPTKLEDMPQFAK